MLKRSYHQLFPLFFLLYFRTHLVDSDTLVGELGFVDQTPDAMNMASDYDDDDVEDLSETDYNEDSVEERDEEMDVPMP